MNGGPPLERLLAHAAADTRMLAVLLFGSAARGEQHAGSDLDVCLVLEPGAADRTALARIKLEYLSDGALDVHLFQQLPLYVRSRVLKEAQILFVRDLDRLYALAAQTTRTFALFRPHYQAYLDEVARGGS